MSAAKQRHVHYWKLKVQAGLLTACQHDGELHYSCRVKDKSGTPLHADYYRAQQLLLKLFYDCRFLKIANSYIKIYQILRYVKCFVSPPISLSSTDSTPTSFPWLNDLSVSKNKLQISWSQPFSRLAATTFQTSCYIDFLLHVSFTTLPQKKAGMFQETCILATEAWALIFNSTNNGHNTHPARHTGSKS